MKSWLLVAGVVIVLATVCSSGVVPPLAPPSPGENTKCVIGCEVPDCPDDQVLDSSGVCREPWMMKRSVKELKTESSTVGVNLFNIINVPSNCPSGYQMVDGRCREIYD